MKSCRRWGCWLGMVAALLCGATSAATARGAEPASAGAESLDELLQQAWDEAGVTPSATAPDAEFLRRAFLDLIGRIPTVAEAEGFLSSKDAHKRAKLVEYLLGHPDYPKNFSNLWTVLLIGRGRQERQVDREALAGWLRRQFGENRPWDQVAYDLVAAEGSNKENGAVNFPLAHLEFDRVPLTSITTRSFLGLQIQCTQCHDHPTNDWKQADFWGINAFFKGTRRRDVQKPDATGAEQYDHTELSDQPTELFASYERRNGMEGMVPPVYVDGRKIPLGADVNRRKELAKFIRGDEQLARAFVNRMWGHFLGVGFVHPVDDFGPHNPAKVPEALELLTEEFRAGGYDVKALVRRITASRAYNLTSATTRSNEKDERLFSHVTLKPMTPEQLFESLLTATAAHKAGGGGDRDRRRDAWIRQFVVTFGNDEAGEASGFQGTIPQALMMMNGELMDRATSGQPGSFLADVLERATQQRRLSPEVYAIQRLYLAALSRPPSSRELAQGREFFRTFPDKAQVLEDLFWALLNSNEFILNR